MEKIYAAIVYVVKFITDQKFQWQQPWVRKFIKKCSFIHENLWTSFRFLGGPTIWGLSVLYRNNSSWLPVFVAIIFAFLVLIILSTFLSTDWIDGKVIVIKEKIGTKFGSVLDGVADRSLILPVIFCWGWWFEKIIYLPLFILLCLIEIFSYILLEFCKRNNWIKGEGNFYEHLDIGKYKFGLQSFVGFLLWIEFFFCPTWEWWPLIMNVLLGIITILAGFACVCKIKMSLVRFMADFFTLGNGICGIFSIVYAYQNLYPAAAVLIMVGAGFDLVDGFIAGRTKKSGSIFGVLMDSFADLITFGLAPAYLAWRIGGLPFIAVAYFVTTFIRLVVYIWRKKEKVQMKRSKFSGFPSTAAGIIIASVVFARFSAGSIESVVAICALMEVAFMFEWYHFKNIFSLPITIQVESFGLLLLSIIIGRGGEGMLMLLTAYAIFFFKPLADRLLWKD